MQYKHESMILLPFEIFSDKGQHRSVSSFLQLLLWSVQKRKARRELSLQMLTFSFVQSSTHVSVGSCIGESIIFHTSYFPRLPVSGIHCSLGGVELFISHHWLCCWHGREMPSNNLWRSPHPSDGVTEPGFAGENQWHFWMSLCNYFVCPPFLFKLLHFSSTRLFM